MRRLLGAAADALNAVGLGNTAFRFYERAQALAPAAADPSLPPAYLRVLTAGTADPEAFVRLGEAAAREFIELARTHGAAAASGEPWLDFGCGCGRVARPLGELAPVALHGCDINPRLLAWCRDRFRGEYALTRLAPPTPYAEAQFALVYSLSVFTHMHEPQAAAWFAELARVVRPGGLALLTFLDERLPAARSLEPRLSTEGFAVRREGAEGSNLLCGYFTPAGFAARAAPHWTMLKSVPSDRSANGQAVAVLRRL